MSPELTLLLQLVVGGVAIGGVYSLIALGFVLIYKATDVLNLAHGELLLVGAYVSYALIAQVGLPLPVALLGTFAFAIVWKRYSFPILLAGSPVHFSSEPRIANFTPALCMRRANAATTLRLRSSNEPAHPTQNR